MQVVRLVGYGIYLLGVVLLVIGFLMPASLASLAVHQSPSSTQVIIQRPQPQGCGVSVTTITGTNGTRRVYNVTCAETIAVSAGVTVTFIPGIESLSTAFSSMFTVLSIVSAIGVAIVTIVFQSPQIGKMGKRVLIPSFLALWAFSVAIVLTVFYALSGPLSGSPLPIWGIYALVMSTLWGLGFSMFALAGILVASPR